MHARGPICTWSIAASLDTPWLPTALLPGHYIDTAFGLQLLVHTPCLHGLLAWAGAAFATTYQRSHVAPDPAHSCYNQPWHYHH